MSVQREYPLKEGVREGSLHFKHIFKQIKVLLLGLRETHNKVDRISPICAI